MRQLLDNVTLTSEKFVERFTRGRTTKPSILTLLKNLVCGHG